MFWVNKQKYAIGRKGTMRKALDVILTPFLGREEPPPKLSAVVKRFLPCELSEVIKQSNGVHHLCQSVYST